MLRRIIQINEEKCDGCGVCASACHEGAIGIVDGKARLLRDDYCDGLGDCLPACPAEAISFVEREAAAYDEEAVKAYRAEKDTAHEGCPGSRAHEIEHSAATDGDSDAYSPMKSQLAQWPTQIKLVPVNAPFFNGADLLIAADCCAYASAEFHNRFMKGHTTLIGCPKLDGEDYSEKLSEIFRLGDIKNVVVARMDVPCCGGIVQAVRAALKKSGKKIPGRVVTIATNGHILQE